MAFICGSFNNHQDQEDDFDVLWPTTSPSRKTKRHRFCCRRNKSAADNNKKKNPYSNRGLEKFEALLADLDDKKQKIFTQKGSHYISFVRFVYSNSNDVKPIIVRLRDPRKLKHDRKQNSFKETKGGTLSLSLPKKLQASTSFNHHRRNSEPPGAVVTNGMIDAQQDVKPIPSIDQLAKKIRVDQLKWNMRRKLEEWWMPAYNLPLFVILVLAFLTFFGRSLAIICTSIAWYMIPTIDGTLENMTPKPKKMIKNERTSEISIISPKPFLSGPINVRQKRDMKKLTSF
ncbi:hypothetical protein Ccrd_023513 [Cynara cardunculus var. scolymus]|uniref:ZCF37 n=1 Tax=Cynara cardunculus var. scolymus TaxID=59895 RepID=A0A103XWN2_CYNCS|nr:hypothetical protein Ccrd_023513 [Cynara cardunculus var. scolymus]